VNKLRTHGFTIIELLIATVVFSIVLLVLTGAIIQIGRLYSKGITASKTQEAARSLMSDVTEAAQYQAGSIEPKADDDGLAWCVGGRHYSYKLGQQRTGGTQHAVIAQDLNACDGPQSLTSATISGAEMLGEGMRLTKFDIIPVDGTENKAYTITVRVVYGSSDLLCDGGTTVSCDSTSGVLSDAAAVGDIRCKDIRAGTQFCSASELKTTVERRLVR
jgi:prepilin-type N-terminal cleavage/methylation domain-containing protein